MIGKILVGLGGTRYAKAATRTAIEIARRHDATLTGVTVANLDKLQSAGAAPIGAGAIAKELGEQRVAMTREGMRECVDQFAALCTEAGVGFDIKKEERDEAFDFLFSQARYHDTTVLGLKAIFEYGAPGAVEDDPALTLIKLLSSGVRPIIATPDSYHPVKRVFVAYSGSVESAATLRRFVQMRPWNEITMRVATFGVDEQRARRLLGHATDYCSSQHVKVATHYYPESPASHLLTAAKEWGADLIVLGNSAKSLLLRRVLGETALHVIRNAEQPLFLGQ